MNDCSMGKIKLAKRWVDLAVVMMASAMFCATASGQTVKSGSSSGPEKSKVNELNPAGVRFQDVTKAAGIRFHHERAESAEKLYLETMGAGVGWIDYDQD